MVKIKNKMKDEIEITNGSLIYKIAWHILTLLIMFSIGATIKEEIKKTKKIPNDNMAMTKFFEGALTFTSFSIIIISLFCVFILFGYLLGYL